MFQVASWRSVLLAGTFAGLLLGGQRAFAQSAPSAAVKATKPGDLAAVLRPILQRHNVPGMVAALVEGSDVTACGAAGVRRQGSPEKVALDDRFHLGSCTKSMTATLVAMLVEERKLAWTSTPAQIFPELAAKMNPAYRSATLEQLLTHRSGAPNLSRGLASLAWMKAWLRRTAPPMQQRRLLVEEILALEPDSPPGTKFLYSNAGYTIAGVMAERAAGRPWEDLMRDRLFRPLGMASAGFGPPGVAGKVDQPRGHFAYGSPVEPGVERDNLPAIGPAGAVHAAIGDWAKYVALHLRGAQGDARLLKPQSFARLHTPAPDESTPYAMGWGVVERAWGGGRVLSHAGSNGMWFCVAWLAPKRNFAVLVACNQGGDTAAKACDDAAKALIQKHLERDRDKPR